jgi:DNA-binding NtrC family response regulator
MNDNNRILIIDDNVSIHEDFRKILTPHKTTSESLDKMNAMLVGTKQLARLPDFELSFASQGEQGVEMIQAALDEKRPYALTFVDV